MSVGEGKPGAGLIRLFVAGALIGVAAPALAGQQKAAPPVAAAATPPEPIGKVGDWFPADSYPAAAKTKGEQGLVGFALELDAQGRVLDCRITQSSGSELLDSTTCSQLILNGRFRAARDASGRAVAGRWESAMRWKLAETASDAE